MGRVPNPKSATLPAVRVTDALREAMERRATMANISLAEYIRRVLIQHLAVRPDAGR